MKKIILPLFLLFASLFSSAQTYTFNGNGNWSDDLNWLNSIKPPTPILPNSIININPAINGQCIVNVPITIPATATLNVMPGSQFIILGNLTILSPNNNGTKLLKELLLVAKLSGGYDTSGALVYYYDNLNRMSVTIDCNFGNSTNDTTDNRYFRYYYYGNDTLPYKRTLTYYPGSYYTDTSFYTYYPDGRMDYDSLVHYSNPPLSVSFSATAKKFFYNNDSTKLDTRRYSNGLLNSSAHRYIYQSRNNGNVVYQYDSLGSAVANTNISHLPNTNPFYKAMRCGMEDIIKAETSGWEWQDAPKNLIQRWRKVNTTSVSTIEDDINISYTLRSDGYPVEADVSHIYISNGGVPSADVFKVVYVYE